MKFFGICFIALCLQLASAVPAAEPAIRAKRKIETATEPEPKIPEKKDVPIKLDDNAIMAESDTDKQERHKKQAAYVKVPCSKACGAEAKATGPEFVILNHEQPAPAMELKGKAARTIEPIYSFGPVSVNGAGNAYSSGYSHQAPKPYSGYQSSASYASPSGMQFHAVIPYGMVHRQPLQHHFANLHAIQAPMQIKPEISYYFEHPQDQVYVETEEHGETHEQKAPASPVSLYCQSMKSKDLIKALAPEGKANTTDEDVSVNDHIQRVNEIKEEISQLNQAAQRIVDQQEKLAQMQQEHMSRAAEANPELLRSPLHHPMRFRRPFSPGMFRENEDQESNPKEVDPKGHEEMMMRQYYPSPYDAYYGYRSAMPYYPAYETGFPLYRARSSAPPPVPMPSPAAGQPMPKSKDDAEFFMRMLDMGKKMGVLSSDFQPAFTAPPKKEEKDDDDDEEPKEESLLTDLAYGDKQKKEKSDEPMKMEVVAEEPKPMMTRKDKRGLLPKKS